MQVIVDNPNEQEKVRGWQVVTLSGNYDRDFYPVLFRLGCVDSDGKQLCPVWVDLVPSLGVPDLFLWPADIFGTTLHVADLKTVEKTFDIWKDLTVSEQKAALGFCDCLGHSLEDFETAVQSAADGKIDIVSNAECLEDFARERMQDGYYGSIEDEAVLDCINYTMLVKKTGLDRDDFYETEYGILKVFD